MKCDLCEVPMTRWNFSKDVWHCPNCGNVIIEDI